MRIDYRVPVNAKSKKSTNSSTLFVLFKRPKDAQPHRLLCDQRGLGALPPNKQFSVFAQAKNWEMGIVGPTMHCLLFLLRIYFFNSWQFHKSAHLNDLNLSNGRFLWLFYCDNRDGTVIPRFCCRVFRRFRNRVRANLRAPVISHPEYLRTG